MSHQYARSSTPSSSSTRSSSNTSYGFGSSTHSSHTSATGGSACHGGPGSDKSLYDSPTSVGQRVFRPINSPMASSSASSWGPSDNAPTMASYELYHGYMPSTPASSTLGGGSSWSSPTLVQPSPSYSGYQDLSPYVLSPVPSNASGIQLNPCLQTGNIFMLDFLRYEQDAHRLVKGPGDPAFMPGMANAEIRFMQFKSGTCHVQARNQAYITVQDVLDSVYRFLQQNDQSPHHAPQGNFRPGTPTVRSGGRPSTPTPTGHCDRRVRRINLIASLGMTRYGGMVRAHGPNTWILHFVQ